MKWEDDIHSKKLIIENGFVKANVFWSLDGSGYEVTINGLRLKRKFQSIDDAKASAEKFIFIKLNKCIDEMKNQNYKIID